jgi:hypothetical protein
MRKLAAGLGLLLWAGQADAQQSVGVTLHVTVPPVLRLDIQHSDAAAQPTYDGIGATVALAASANVAWEILATLSSDTAVVVLVTGPDGRVQRADTAGVVVAQGGPGGRQQVLVRIEPADAAALIRYSLRRR